MSDTAPFYWKIKSELANIGNNTGSLEFGRWMMPGLILPLVRTSPGCQRGAEPHVATLGPQIIPGTLASHSWKKFQYCFIV